MQGERHGGNRSTGKRRVGVCGGNHGVHKHADQPVRRLWNLVVLQLPDRGSGLGFAGFSAPGTGGKPV